MLPSLPLMGDHLRLWDRMARQLRGRPERFDGARDSLTRSKSRSSVVARNDS